METLLNKSNLKVEVNITANEIKVEDQNSCSLFMEYFLADFNL